MSVIEAETLTIDRGDRRIGVPTDHYLVWSNEHRRWWGPGFNGYVKSLSAAGRYTQSEALRICRDAIGTSAHLGVFAELPVRLADVEAFIERQPVPANLLREEW